MKIKIPFLLLSVLVPSGMVCSQNVELPPPAEFGYALPYKVYKTADGGYSHDYDFTAGKPQSDVTIYVGPGGKNENDGQTHENRVRSLKRGLALAAGMATAENVVRVLADPGIYRNVDVDDAGIENGFAGQSIPFLNHKRRRVIIESSGPGKVISTVEQIMPAFAPTADPHIYVSTWTTENPSRGIAWDESNPNAKGRPQALRNIQAGSSGKPVADINAPWPEMNALWEQYPKHGVTYLDMANKKMYVRLFDNRAPDTHLRVGKGTGPTPEQRNLFISIAGSPRHMSMWVRNVELWGGATLYTLVDGKTGGLLDLYMQDCATCYGRGDGVHVDGPGTVILQRHTADDNIKDGYNFQVNSGGEAYWHELDCVGDWNGNDNNAGDSSSNASSYHQTGVGVRINCSYAHTQNRAVHDIQDVKTWNVGVKVSDARQKSGRQSGSFTSGFLALTGATTRMWLEGCVSSGAAYDLQAYNGGTLYYRNMDDSGLKKDIENGAISSY